MLNLNNLMDFCGFYRGKCFKWWRSALYYGKGLEGLMMEMRAPEMNSWCC